MKKITKRSLVLAVSVLGVWGIFAYNNTGSCGDGMPLISSLGNWVWIHGPAGSDLKSPKEFLLVMYLLG